MKPQKKLLPLLLVIGLVTVLTNVAQAATESINVDAEKEVIRTVDLASGDFLSLSFTVTGPEPSKLHFYAILPNGNTSDYGNTSRFSIDFSTEVEGECHLHFDNTNSQSTQLITLNYDVVHYIFGIPQMIFLLIAITILLLFVVGGYIIMGKYG